MHSRAARNGLRRLAVPGDRKTLARRRARAGAEHPAIRAVHEAILGPVLPHLKMRFMAINATSRAMQATSMAMDVAFIALYLASVPRDAASQGPEFRIIPVVS